MEQIEGLFDLEVREKKRSKHYAAARKKTGVKSSRGGVLTQYDFLSPEERKKLNGEVEVYNMYETILTINEFNLKEEDQQKVLMTRWRELYSNKKIAEDMGIPEYKVYEIVKKLGIKRKIKSGPRKGKTAGKKEKTQLQEIEKIETTPRLGKASAESINLIPRGEQWSYNNVYTGKKLVSHLEKLLILIDGEDETEFDVSILIAPRYNERN